MSLGTGIFLSALIIVIVILYGLTKDRISWKTLIIRFFGGLVVLATLSGLTFWGYYEYSNRITTQYAFMGLNLSDSKSDIKFKMGKPDETNEFSWTYKGSTGNNDITIFFEEDKIHAVIIGGTCRYCGNLYQLGIGDSYKKVLERIGEPSKIIKSNDDLSRVMVYETYNMAFFLAKNEIIFYGIYNPEIAPFNYILNRDK